MSQGACFAHHGGTSAHHGAQLNELSAGARASAFIWALPDSPLILGNKRATPSPNCSGGYGYVYRGTWHKRPAAIKVGLLAWL